MTQPRMGPSQPFPDTLGRVQSVDIRSLFSIPSQRPNQSKSRTHRNINSTKEVWTQFRWDVGTDLGDSAVGVSNLDAFLRLGQVGTEVGQ